MLLSIGMIVKNEEKNLRECLLALKPILDELDAELIIADTGSTDNTVSIAREFTDKIYSFVWCKDFSAARNVTIKHSLGEWFMFVDADEYFMETADLISFFKSGEYKKYNSATYIQRNFTNYDKSSYSDFNAPRLTKLLKETEFVSPIHERLNTFDYPLKVLTSYVDHFGYVSIDKEMIQQKSARNIELLIPLLEKNPQELMLYIQLAESYFAVDFDKAISYCDMGIAEAKKTGDDVLFALYCKKATAISSRNIHDEAFSITEEYFKARKNPLPIGTDIEMYAIKGAALHALKNFKDAISAFKTYAKLYKDFHKGLLRTNDTFMYSMNFVSESNFRNAMYSMVHACIEEKKFNTATIYSMNIPLADRLHDRLYTESRILQEFEIMNGIGDYSSVITIMKQLDESYTDYINGLIRNKCEDIEIRNLLLPVLAKAKLPKSSFIDIIKLNYDLYIKKSLLAKPVTDFLESTELISPECADIIYMALYVNIPLDLISKRISESDIPTFLSGCFSYCPDFADVLINYSAVNESYAKFWLSELYFQTMIAVGLSSSKQITLFNKYTETIFSYMQDVFKAEFLNIDNAHILPERFRTALLCRQSIVLLENGENQKYLSCLKSILKSEPALKETIKALGDKLHHEITAKRSAISEFEQLSITIKNNISNLISVGKLDEAKTALNSYAQLNPNDSDIEKFRQSIK